MASVTRADHFGEDWSDNEEITHEIVLSDTEITEQEENIRTESGARRTGPVWVATEVSETAQTEPDKNEKYRAPKHSTKIAPTKDALNFPSFGDPSSDKPSQKTEGKEDKTEKLQSNNRYEKLEIKEEEGKTEEKTAKKPAKKGKKKKNEWKKLETKVKIASTVEQITADTIFQKEAPKLPERISYQSESRSFNIKPSGEGFRNFENKQETGFKPFENNRPGAGFRPTDIKPSGEGFRNFDAKPSTGFRPAGEGNPGFRPAGEGGAGFRAAGEGNIGFLRRTDNFPEAGSENKPVNVWRKGDEPNNEQKKDDNAERPVKKFFNAKKAANPVSINPLEPSAKPVQEVKNDVWGDNVKDDGKKKNPWGRTAS